MIGIAKLGALAILAVAVGVLIVRFDTKEQDLSMPPAAESPASAYDLQLLSQSCDSNATNDAVVVTGSIRNVGGADLRGVVVLAIFLNTAGAQVAQANGSLSPPDLAQQGVANFRAESKNPSEVERCVVRFVSNTGSPMRVDYSPVQQLPAAVPTSTP